MRHEAGNRNAETRGYRPTCRRITGRTLRTVALTSAIDAPDPSWLPEPIDEWDLDNDVIARYATARQRD